MMTEKNSIYEHLDEYQKRWTFMDSTLAGEIVANQDTLKEFAENLRGIEGNDRAKAEFLLLTLPAFYSGLVENLRTKSSYTYGDIVR